MLWANLGRNWKEGISYLYILPVRQAPGIGGHDSHKIRGGPGPRRPAAYTCRGRGLRPGRAAVGARHGARAAAAADGDGGGQAYGPATAPVPQAHRLACHSRRRPPLPARTVSESVEMSDVSHTVDSSVEALIGESNCQPLG